MRPNPEASPERRSPASGALGALFVSGLLALVFVACGITLGRGEKETEIFKRLTITGDFTPGGELVLALEYAQPYPTAIDVDCDLLTTERPTATPRLTPTPTKERWRTPTPTPVLIPRPKPTPANKVLDILLETIGPNAEGGPADEATPVPGSFSRRFPAPERPGRYLVRCFTPADENNQIFESIRIAPGAAPAP